MNLMFWVCVFFLNGNQTCSFFFSQFFCFLEQKTVFENVKNTNIVFFENSSLFLKFSVFYFFQKKNTPETKHVSFIFLILFVFFEHTNL